MKVIAINASPRKNGNTNLMLKEACKPLNAAGIETEIIQIGGKLIRGCTACGKCGQMQNNTCIFKDDLINDLIDKFIEADGIILGSPTYFADVTTEMKALIDRVGYVSLSNSRPLKHKVGAAVVAVRRAGAIHAFDTMNHFFQINKMFIVGSTYWNMGFGREIGEVRDDEEGLNNMLDLGQSMAFLLEKLK